MESCPINGTQNKRHRNRTSKETHPTQTDTKTDTRRASLLVLVTSALPRFLLRVRQVELVVGKDLSRPGHGSGRAWLSLVLARKEQVWLFMLPSPRRHAYIQKPGRGSGTLAIGHPTQRPNVSRNRFCMARSCCRASAWSLVIPTACTVSAVSRASSWGLPPCNKSWYTVAAIIAQ